MSFCLYNYMDKSIKQNMSNSEISGIVLKVVFGLSMLGALIAIGCYLPGVIKVFKYKDTRSISTLMFKLTTIGCVLWIIIAILQIIGYSLSKPSDYNDYIFSLAAGLGTLVSNIGLGTCSLLILFKKISNVRKAKKRNMTEDEYYKKVIEPTINEKNRKQKQSKN